MNVILIGMPGSGKSSVGVVLAKRLGMDFLDTDIVIQKKTQKRLSEIISEEGVEEFLKLEEEVNASLQVEDTIIAPGGSVVYGEKAMHHFREIGVVIYLKIGYKEMISRIGDIHTRGVALPNGMKLSEMYEERDKLYEQYAHYVVDELHKTKGKVISEIVSLVDELLLGFTKK